MTDTQNLAPNVQAFLDIASKQYGKIKAADFKQDMYCQVIEGQMQSPIEHLFLIACHAMCALQCVEINPDPLINDDYELDSAKGFYIHQQAMISKYRVDFLIFQIGWAPSKMFTPVIVELDGHAFHDKNKEQRAYEKARDRALVRDGYKVLHFTGSEVNADPFKVAFEALSLAGLFVGADNEEYDPKNPLGVE
jgi:very-short-patch-repair endonuclease